MSENRYYDNADWPCINIKSRGGFGAEDIQERYNCDAKTAQNLADGLWELGTLTFWQDVKDKVRSLLGKDAEPYQFGRSGGWLTVSTLRNLTERADYDGYTGDPEEDEREFEVNRRALAELETFCRARIREMEKLDYWDEYIRENNLAAGWYCDRCGAFHPSKA
jgi:hypothetical protein